MFLTCPHDKTAIIDSPLLLYTKKSDAPLKKIFVDIVAPEKKDDVYFRYILLTR